VPPTQSSIQSPLFHASHLHKRYGGTTVVDDLSFEIAPGECLGVIGPNGAGKTTTIRMCLGLTAPDGGDISALGLQMPRDALAIKAQLGVVTQFDTLDPDFSCAENLVVYGRYFGFSKSQILPRVPKLLLLDEPTTGLDPQARHLMWERLQLLLQQGKSILLTTHFMDEAERLCSRLIVIDHGRKIAEGRPRDLIAEHLEPDVVELYGDGALELAQSPLKDFAARVEVSGETVFFYTQDARGLMAALGDRSGLRTFHRPANLEDLFLKLTGRQIREDG